MRFRVAVLALAVVGTPAVAGDPPGALVVRALDPTGTPIPNGKASLTVRVGRNDVGYWHADLREGMALFPKTVIDTLVSGRKVDRFAVDVYGARDARGRPLSLAPRTVEEMRPPRGGIEVRLAEGLEIRGVAVDETGIPLPEVAVVARPRGQRFVEGPPTSPMGIAVHAVAETGADGAFRLVGVDARAYDIWLRDVFSREMLTPIPTTARGGDGDVRVVRSPMFAVRLRVVGPDKRPVRDAWVVVHPVPHRHLTDSARTDSDGEVRLKRLSRGARYALWIQVPEDRDDLCEHRIPDWSPVDGEISMPGGWTASGVVVDAHGKGVRAALVAYSPSGSGTMQFTAADGTFRVRGLRREPVELGAMDADGDDLPPFPAQSAPLPWVRATPEEPVVRVPLGRAAPSGR